MVKRLQLGILFERVADQPEALGPAAFDDRCQQEPVEEAVDRIGFAEVHQALNVGVLFHLFGQVNAAFRHVRINLLKMLKLLDAGFDQLGNDLEAIGIFRHETHRHSRGFALAIRVVLQERREIGHHGRDPLGPCSGG